jgi:hypothetical protein
VTSRCRRTGLVRYTTKTKAVRAIQKTPHREEPLTAVHCSYRGDHWHILPTGEQLPHVSGVFDPGQWDEATMQLWSRCRDLCEWCDRPLAGQMVRHHRMRKQDGGDRLCNLVALHDACHKYVHEHPLEAKDRGFIVPPGGDLPTVILTRVPIVVGSRSYWLTDDGRRVG